MLVCLGTRTTIIIHNQSPPLPTRLSDSLRSQICPPMLMREVFGLGFPAHGMFSGCGKLNFT